MVINLDATQDEIWVHSNGCATNCIRNIMTETMVDSFCYMKYDLYEPIYEDVITDYMQLGVHNKIDENGFRYTGMFFFGNSFKSMLEIAEEIELTFEISNDSEQFLGTEQDDSKDIFYNNILIKGHSYGSYEELKNNWSNAYSEFRYNLSCPYMHSIYKDLKDVLTTDQTSFSVRLNSALLKEFSQYGVKGIQLYCHNNLNGYFLIGKSCKIRVTRFKNFYNEYYSSKESIVVKNKRMYDDKFFHIGNLNYHRFYFFENEFVEALKIAKKIELTFNLLWYLPTKDESNTLNINNNYLAEGAKNNSVILVGHTFESIEELELCETKKEFFEDDVNHRLTVYNSFKKALDEGHTSYTFQLQEDDIKLFKEQGVKGIRIGLLDNGMGYFRMSEFCSVKVVEYTDDYSSIYNASDTENWININKPTFIGHENEISDAVFAAFYFFNDTLYESLYNKSIENITIRFYFNYDYYKAADSNLNAEYYICTHNYENLDAINSEYISRRNILCSFKITQQNPAYRDIILSKNQIENIKNAKGLCFYSKNNSLFTVHGDSISVFIDYMDENNGRVYDREFDALELKSFVKETKVLYDDDFIVGSNNIGELYRPYMFIGDNFQSFMVNEDNIVNVKIQITADNKRLIDNRTSVYEPLSIDFYTHGVSVNQLNYSSYKYSDFLFTADLGNSDCVEINLTSKQIELLKNSFGLGAFTNSNKDNNFIVIKDFKIIVTYMR